MIDDVDGPGKPGPSLYGAERRRYDRSVLEQDELQSPPSLTNIESLALATGLPIIVLSNR
ncbi:MAG: hypothetical protein WC538_21580 [Thermoanaerobaculia bacterium]|jgi:hypothetical protein